MDLKRIFLISMIISLSVSALVGILIFLLGNFGQTQIRILLTTLSIGGFSLAGLCSANLYDKGTFKTFGAIGMVTAFFGFLINLFLIWIDFNSFSFNLGLTLIVLSFSFSHASLLMLIKSEKIVVSISFWVTLFFIAWVATVILSKVWGLVTSSNYRIFAVFVILDILGTVVTPILNKVMKNAQEIRAV